MGFKIRLASGRDVTIGWIQKDFNWSRFTLFEWFTITNIAFDTTATSILKCRKMKMDKAPLSPETLIVTSNLTSYDIWTDTSESSARPTNGHAIEQLSDSLWIYQEVQLGTDDTFGLTKGQYLSGWGIASEYNAVTYPTASSLVGISWGNYIRPYYFSSDYTWYNRFSGWNCTDPDKVLLVFVPYGQTPGNITDYVILETWQFGQYDGALGSVKPLYKNNYSVVASSSISEYDPIKTIILNWLNGASLVEEPDSDPVDNTQGDYDNSTDDIGEPDISIVNSVSALSTNLLRAYTITATEVQTLSDKLWSDDFIDNIKKVQNAPIDNIIKLHCLPFEVATSGTEAVKVGNVSMGFDGSIVSDQFQEFDCGTMDLMEYYGTFLDYKGTTVSIFLPFIGERELDISDVNQATLHLKYRIDVLTGNCTATLNIARNRDSTELNSILYQWTGNCSNEFPLTQRTNQTLTKLVGDGISAASSIASSPYYAGSYIGSAMNMGMDAATAAIGGNSYKVTRTGQLSGSSGFMGVLTPYLIINRPVNVKPSNYEKYYGYPSYYTRALGDVKGFTKVHAMISTQPEGICQEDWDDIVSLLKEGVIIGDLSANPITPTPSPTPSPTTITVDSNMSNTSTNPVQNKVIYAAIQSAQSAAITTSEEYTNSNLASNLNAAKAYADTKLTEAKAYTDEVVEDIEVNTTEDHTGTGTSVTNTVASGSSLDDVTQTLLNNDTAINADLAKSFKTMTTLVDGAEYTTATTITIPDISQYKMIVVAQRWYSSTVEYKAVPTLVLTGLLNTISVTGNQTVTVVFNSTTSATITCSAEHTRVGIYGIK